MKTPKRKSIYIRNGIIFFLVYVFMMGVLTYVTATNAKKRMDDKTTDATTALDNTMRQSSTMTNHDQSTLLGSQSIYSLMCFTMSNAAYEHIYLRAEMYDGNDKLIGKTGNVLFLTTADYKNQTSFTLPPYQNQFICLDKYMSTNEINSFFAPNQLYSTQFVEVTGTDDGVQEIFPQEIKLFGTLDPATLINTKKLKPVSCDAKDYGITKNWPGDSMTTIISNCNASFERIADSGPITKTDQKRYAECTKIAAPDLQKYREKLGGYPSYLITNNLLLVQFSYVDQFGGLTPEDARCISVGVEYFPLEVAISQLVSIYIWSFIFVLILMLFLSAKMSGLFKKQAALERQRRELTDAIAHELKTPLGIIRGYSEGLREKINEDKRDRYLDVIIDETAYMDAMVLDMLALSRLEAGRTALDPAVTPVKEMADHVLARFEKMTEDKSLAVEVAIRDDAVITCDRAMIELALSNFISNAVRHTPEGGGIRVAAALEDGRCAVSVENTGSPIPAEAMPHLWDAYYKADAARPRAEGTGLGLSIAKSILERHGFAYGAENTETGVKFWFSAKAL